MNVKGKKEKYAEQEGRGLCSSPVIPSPPKSKPLLLYLHKGRLNKRTDGKPLFTSHPPFFYNSIMPCYCWHIDCLSRVSKLKGERKKKRKKDCKKRKSKLEEIGKQENSGGDVGGGPRAISFVNKDRTGEGGLWKKKALMARPLVLLK